jgi:hypothetical protein
MSCADPKQLLRVMEAFWAAMKDGKAVPAPNVIKRQPGTCLPSAPQYDVAVAGGTLGILLATALQARGHRVAVIERRRLEGRLQGVAVRLHCFCTATCVYGICTGSSYRQAAHASYLPPQPAHLCHATAASAGAEWNIGRGELGRLVACGVLTQHEVDSCVTSEFGPVRWGPAPGRAGGWGVDCVGVAPASLQAFLPAHLSVISCLQALTFLILLSDFCRPLLLLLLLSAISVFCQGCI